ncbi:uncharacterized protein [Apostichopus japonicus]|uniref:uncharacterized protein n=1 Tax=Stichopus japonicus TaxID=307972 RepID=UPI003AB27393
MQGIKMTNEAIHGRMKTLKDSVVKSEDSVKGLVAEIKMLGQRVVQSHKAIQKEEEPEPPIVSTMEQLPERPPEDLNLEETCEDDEKSDRDNKLESQAPIANSYPFTILIMNMKASISSPSKVRSNSDQIRKGLPDDNLLKAEEDRKFVPTLVATCRTLHQSKETSRWKFPPKGLEIGLKLKKNRKVIHSSYQIVLPVLNFQDHKLFEPPMLQLHKRYIFVYIYIYIIYM